ncbi:putative Replication factor C subunit 1 [Blattamonas nauphoetae]|uniref:Replication factor C subunit 1 n=1 Tax=Blattamonas nauphoetae TaxID=2049346 RepID=A0ABQ9YM79_9EUKA|nr:putative Replication factor C subunit 1 [Blattamonas nauphoetae]
MSHQNQKGSGGFVMNTIVNDPTVTKPKSSLPSLFSPLKGSKRTFDFTNSLLAPAVLPPPAFVNKPPENTPPPVQSRERTPSPVEEPVQEIDFESLKSSRPPFTPPTPSSQSQQRNSQPQPISLPSKPPAKEMAVKKKTVLLDDESTLNTLSEDDTPPTSPKPKVAAPNPKPATPWKPPVPSRSFAPSNPGSKPLPVGKPNCLAGLSFVITGQLSVLSRTDCEQLIKSYGGAIRTAVSKNTNYLVKGAEIGFRKLEKAKEVGTKILSEDELFALIEKSDAKDASEAQALTVPKKVLDAHATAADPSSDQWVEKYRPKKIEDIVGNGGCVKQLLDWLENWSPHSKQKRTRKDKDDSGTAKKAKQGVGLSDANAALLSGPPGIGKTTAAHVVAKEAGYSVLEFNASDTRSKGALVQVVQQALQSHSLTTFWGKRNDAPNQAIAEKTCVIMDEVDGMQAGDRGGMAQLIKLIETTHVPIICICNDSRSQKVKSLRNHCLDLPFKRPLAASIIGRLIPILNSEAVSSGRDKDGRAEYDRNVLNAMISATNGDIRQVLTMAQMWQDTPFDQKNFSSRLRDKTNKDIALNVFNVAPRLLQFMSYHEYTISQRMDYYFVDSSLVPLIVAENYVRCEPMAPLKYPTRASNWQGCYSQREMEDSFMAAAAVTLENEQTHNVSPPKLTSANRPFFADQNSFLNSLATNASSMSLSSTVFKTNKMSNFSTAAESMSFADLIERKIKSEQMWSLAPHHAIASSITPGFSVRGTISDFGGMAGYGGNENVITFPSILGHISSAGKWKRYVHDVRLRSQPDLDCTDRAMQLDGVINVLKLKLTEPFRNNDIGGEDDEVGKKKSRKEDEESEEDTPNQDQSSIDQVLEVMRDYGLTRQDWDDLQSLTTFKQSKQTGEPLTIPTKTKSQFTRMANAFLAEQAVKSGTVASLKKGKNDETSLFVKEMVTKGKGKKGQTTKGRGKSLKALKVDSEQGEEEEVSEEEEDIGRKGILEL